jgi:hypothetical protein
VGSQPNPLHSTFYFLANPFSFSSLEPTHPSHNVRVHPSRCHYTLCRFHGCPCALCVTRVRCSIGTLTLQITADLFATSLTDLTQLPEVNPCPILTGCFLAKTRTRLGTKIAKPYITARIVSFPRTPTLGQTRPGGPAVARRPRSCDA